MINARTNRKLTGGIESTPMHYAIAFIDVENKKIGKGASASCRRSEVARSH